MEYGKKKPESFSDLHILVPNLSGLTPQIFIDRITLDTSHDGILPLELVPLAEDDIHEKQEWIDRDVEALREMILSEADLKSRVDKPFLLAFLRARKYDYDRALTMIRAYYASRLENKEIFHNLKPSSFDFLWPLNIQTVLPFPDKEGRTLLLFRVGAWNPCQVPVADLIRAQIVVLEHIVRCPLTQLFGVSLIVDCRGLSVQHGSSVTIANFKRFLSVVDGVFPLRFKALHFVNEPTIFEWIFGCIRPFLPEITKGRLHFHGSKMESLQDYVDPTVLPEELGGTAGPISNAHLVTALKDQEDYFVDHFKYGYSAKNFPAAEATCLGPVSELRFIRSYFKKGNVE